MMHEGPRAATHVRRQFTAWHNRRTSRQHACHWLLSALQGMSAQLAAHCRRAAAQSASDWATRAIAILVRLQKEHNDGAWACRVR